MITFREAQEDDAKLLFDWRNDPVTIKNSFDSHAVDWEGHKQWLKKKLSDSSCQLFILMDQDMVPVGQVRFDIDQNNTAEVSISIGRDHRQKGYAVEGLTTACRSLIERGNVKNIIAHIKKDNASSYKAFTKAGFTKIKELTVKSCNCYRLEFNG